MVWKSCVNIWRKCKAEGYWQVFYFTHSWEALGKNNKSATRMQTQVTMLLAQTLVPPPVEVKCTSLWGGDIELSTEWRVTNCCMHMISSATSTTSLCCPAKFWSEPKQKGSAFSFCYMLLHLLIAVLRRQPRLMHYVQAETSRGWSQRKGEMSYSSLKYFTFNKEIGEWCLSSH